MHVEGPQVFSSAYTARVVDVELTCNGQHQRHVLNAIEGRNEYLRRRLGGSSAKTKSRVRVTCGQSLISDQLLSLQRRLYTPGIVRLQAHTVPVELQSITADQAAVTELIPAPWPTVARNGMHGASAAGRNRGSGIIRGQLSVTDLSGSGMPGVVQGSLPCQ